MSNIDLLIKDLLFLLNKIVKDKNIIKVHNIVICKENDLVILQCLFKSCVYKIKWKFGEIMCITQTENNDEYI